MSYASCLLCTRLKDNNLTDIIFFREIEKLSDSASSSGPYPRPHISCTLVVSFSFFLSSKVENTQIGIHKASMSRFSGPFCSIIRTHFARQWRTLTLCFVRENFVIPITNSDHTALPLFTQSISTHFCGHARLLESTKLAFIVHFSEFLRTSTYKGDLCFILTQLLLQVLI